MVLFCNARVQFSKFQFALLIFNSIIAYQITIVPILNLMPLILFLLSRVIDINNSLVDDALVDKEKISGSNFFWSFPGKRDRMLQLEHEQILSDIESSKTKIVEAEAKLADAKRGREDEDGERAKKLARLGELRQEKEKMQVELESLKENDPQALADLEKELKLVVEAANRWTDNIFSVSKTYYPILFCISIRWALILCLVILTVQILFDQETRFG